MTTLGFVGLGAMGGRIAGRLLEGHQVYGTNRTSAKAGPLTRRGLSGATRRARSPRRREVMFSMVTDDAALEAIAGGPDGLLAGLAAGQGLRRHEHGQPAGQPRARGAGTRAGRQHARRAGLRQRPGGRGAAASRSWPADRRTAFPAAEPLLRRLGCTVSARRRRTARACCSSSRSTSASPRRCSPSARACCSPSAAGSTGSWPSG